MGFAVLNDLDVMASGQTRPQEGESVMGFGMFRMLWHVRVWDSLALDFGMFHVI